MNGIKNKKKQLKGVTKIPKAHNQSLGVVKKSANCNAYHSNKINFLMTPVKVKKFINEQQQGKELDNKTHRTKSKKQNEKTQKSKPKIGKDEMSTQRKRKNKFTNEKDQFLHITIANQKSNKWISNQQINPPFSAKPEENYFIGQPSQSNQVQKHSKNGTKDNQKIKILKEYILEDSQKIAKMNRIRDDHIINQLSFAESSLKKKQKQQEREREIGEYIIKIQMLKKNHEIAVKEHWDEIKHLEVQLNRERTTKSSLSHKIDEYENTLTLLQRQAYAHKRELEIEKEEKNILRREKQMTMQKLRRSQLNIHQLQDKVSELALTKTQLQQEFKKSFADKQIIKQNANKVLQIVRSQMKSISL